MYIFPLLCFVTTATAEMDSKIVGGGPANIENWPFITFVVAVGGGMASTCGGSLISSQTVLTAAHCLDDVTNSKKNFYKINYNVLMGHNMFSKATMVRVVIDYQTHEGYDPSGTAFDIGIMFLVRPVTFSNTVKKVLLMKRLDRRVTRMEVAGWGLYEKGDGSDENNSPFLKSLKQKVYPYKKCYDFITSPSEPNGIICGGTLNAAEFAYSGDSGGPLIKAGTQIQMGLVSFRLEDQGITVYTSVPHYIKWIEKTQKFLFKKHCGFKAHIRNRPMKLNYDEYDD